MKALDIPIIWKEFAVSIWYFKCFSKNYWLYNKEPEKYTLSFYAKKKFWIFFKKIILISNVILILKCIYFVNNFIFLKYY